jgi:hypothetical protein
MNVVVTIADDGTIAVIGPFRTVNRAKVHAEYLKRENEGLEADSYAVEKPE